MNTEDNMMNRVEIDGSHNTIADLLRLQDWAVGLLFVSGYYVEATVEGLELVFRVDNLEGKAATLRADGVTVDASAPIVPFVSRMIEINLGH